jgi:hypothetical protein
MLSVEGLGFKTSRLQCGFLHMPSLSLIYNKVTSPHCGGPLCRSSSSYSLSSYHRKQNGKLAVEYSIFTFNRQTVARIVKEAKAQQHLLELLVNILV